MLRPRFAHQRKSDKTVVGAGKVDVEFHNIEVTHCHSTSYKINGLERGAQYEFRVKAENIHGVSEPSKSSNLVTLEDMSDSLSELSEDEDLLSSPYKLGKVQLEPGDLFEKKFDQHEELGKGRYGVVYRVSEKQTGHRRAAKLIKCIKKEEKEKVNFTESESESDLRLFYANIRIPSSTNFSFLNKSRNRLIKHPSNQTSIKSNIQHQIKHPSNQTSNKSNIQQIKHPTNQTSNKSNIQQIKHPTYRTSNISNIQHIEHPTYRTSNISNIQHIEHPSNQTSHQNVKEEIEIMNSLRHNKLLQLLAAYERKKDYIFAFIFDLLKYPVLKIQLSIGGGELFERVVADDFALTERDCIHFIRQICEGVEYMHSNSIVHLDLKPENILCVRRSSNQIKLIDFGLAKKLDPDKQCRVLFGTPEFVAPEVINYDPISFASDMWSVGVICYVL
ncbi:Myosin light chain kinase, smooth muscle [Armadillidium nasatum]|uniref:Myosin light chain kinase, smooth muscle n=1 Tax=Armadillidium nasatum TaxID=96803 RepID=A0A5N5SJU7_9CRUS|nr:Myosin light chain kinase, smooth muscle [Armadillidium nasatum]